VRKDTTEGADGDWGRPIKGTEAQMRTEQEPQKDLERMLSVEGNESQLDMGQEQRKDQGFKNTNEEKSNGRLYQRGGWSHTK
jgi:hypothetical protein